MIYPHELVIDDSTPIGAVLPDGFGRGLVLRDYEKYPQGYCVSAPPAQIALIPRNEYVSRIEEMERNKSRVSDVRRSAGPGGGHIPSLDQDGIGYCWNHSIAMVMMLVRALTGQPYVKLSPFMVGCLLMEYRNKGGWAALALEFIAEHGIPTVEFWPEKSMSRSNDTPEMRANALLHRVIEDWADLNASIYDRNLTDDQAMTLLLSRTPYAGDYPWWGHSVCMMDPVVVTTSAQLLATDFGSLDLNNEADVKIYGAAFGKRGLNSWTDNYGDLGEFVLTGSKAICGGAVAPRVTLLSAA